MAAKKNLSVEEILAACRRNDSDESYPAQPEKSTEPSTPAQKSAAAGEPDRPAATAPDAGQDASEMSVADILAAARGKKPVKQKPASSDEPSKPSTAAGTTKAVPPASKTSPTAAKPKPQVPKDTTSILAAARKQQKPGPISKAEATSQAETGNSLKKGKPKIVVPPLPEKPSYAVARRAVPASASENRRGFLSTVMATFIGSFLAVGFTSLGLTNLLWLLGFARFMFPNIRIEPPSTFRVGFPDDFAPGQVETKFKAQYGIWLVRYEYEGQSQIYALKSVCTHLGCTPNWLEGEQKFKCPCHGSGFYKDGINFEGPAPRPLERYAISLAADGQLLVDKSKLFFEEKGQWKDPASFVTV